MRKEKKEKMLENRHLRIQKGKVSLVSDEQDILVDEEELSAVRSTVSSMK